MQCGECQKKKVGVPPRPYFKDHGEKHDETSNGQDSAVNALSIFGSVLPVRESKDSVMQPELHPVPEVPVGLLRMISRKTSVNYRLLMPERIEMDVDKHYHVAETTLGAGSFGAVYLAHDKEFTSRCVAVKNVNKMSLDPVKYPSYTQEIEAMRTLDHPNVCKLFEVFSSEQQIFFIMEFCEGGDLYEWIVKQDNIPEAATENIIRQIASALSYAHMKKIAHRDLKPENICFASKDPENHNVKLCDWGLAGMFEDQPMRESVGTYQYRSPEVMMGKRYDCSCDLWSLGVILFTMLHASQERMSQCPAPVFWGPKHFLLRRATRGDYPMKSEIWDPISDAAKDLVGKLLEPRVHKRLDAAGVLEHEWLQTTEMPMRRISTPALNTLGNIHGLQGLPVFKSICMAAVARQLDYKQLEDIHRIFVELDKDANGILTEDEISAGMSEFLARWPGLDKPGRDNLDFLHSIDLDGNGLIDFTEFCTAALACRPELSEEALWGAFKTFDTDCDGVISLSELETVMKCATIQGSSNSEVCKEACQEIIDRFDIDRNGVIDFKEFKGMMQNNIDCARFSISVC